MDVCAGGVVRLRDAVLIGRCAWIMVDEQAVELAGAGEDGAEVARSGGEPVTCLLLGC
jgi:hypothetical protein